MLRNNSELHLYFTLIKNDNILDLILRPYLVFHHQLEVECKVSSNAFLGLWSTYNRWFKITFDIDFFSAIDFKFNLSTYKVSLFLN